LRPLIFVWNQGGFDFRMLAYLLPQSAAIAIVIALTVGILAAYGGRQISGGAAVRVLALSLAVSAASFVNAGWLTPAANQAFRVAFVERTQPGGPPPQRGINELTLPEVSERYAIVEAYHGSIDRVDLHYLAVSYHGRWALTFAPLVFAIRVGARDAPSDRPMDGRRRRVCRVHGLPFIYGRPQSAGARRPMAGRGRVVSRTCDRFDRARLEAHRSSRGVCPGPVIACGLVRRAGWTRARWSASWIPPSPISGWKADPSVVTSD
jgi:hypothetical protein